VTEKTCPRCKTIHLASVEVAPIVLERCTKCGGSFLGTSHWGKLVQLSKAGSAPVVEPPDARPENAELRDPIACPVCAKTMKTRQHAHTKVLIDVCLTDGMWLDGGEIAAIIAREREAREGAQALAEMKDDAKSVGTDVAVAVAVGGGLLELLGEIVVGIF
jgi:Zn-finger nucleic acid-binding protein